MADIFDRAGQQFGGSFASDAARITFAGAGEFIGGDATSAGGVGLLTQQLQVGYNQQITRLYEIGTNFTFLVAGRTQGQMSAGRVLGPRPVSSAFYKKYGSVCNAATNNITLECDTGCATSGEFSNGLTFLVKNLVLTGVSISVAAEEMTINEQVQAMFVSLEAVSTGADSGYSHPVALLPVNPIA